MGESEKKCLTNQPQKSIIIIVKNLKRELILGFLFILFLSYMALALAAPSNLNVNFNPEKKFVELSWSAVSGAVGYNVYRKEATDPDYQKISKNAVMDTHFEDASLTRGRDYLYAVKALDLSGAESLNSPGAGGPRMSLITQALVTTNRDKPVTARSIKTGKVVSFAAPGDIVTYRISYANQGCSSAKNVNINYTIPNGTMLAGAPRIKKGAAAQISYFDQSRQKWMSNIDKEENISKVRFLIPETIPPVKDSGDTSGIIDLNVVITL